MCFAMVALLAGAGIALGAENPQVAGCVAYETYSGSGSYSETRYCPDRFQPSHETDHFVTEIDSPPTPVQTQTVVTYEAPYYNPPACPPAPRYVSQPRHSPAWPVWRYSYQTRNPWSWGARRPYWACAR
jgi:hypothetical protein